MLLKKCTLNCKKSPSNLILSNLSKILDEMTSESPFQTKISHDFKDVHHSLSTAAFITYPVIPKQSEIFEFCGSSSATTESKGSPCTSSNTRFTGLCCLSEQLPVSLSPNSALPNERHLKKLVVLIHTNHHY